MDFTSMKLLEAVAADGRERELALALDPGKIPAHIAIIMDGNGRWRNGAVCLASPATKPVLTGCGPWWKTVRVWVYES